MRLRYLFLLLALPLSAQTFLPLLGPAVQGITLEEFGILGNTNIPLMYETRASSPTGSGQFERFNPNEPPRTNDFQALQQSRAQDRQPIRMGYFYVSQGPDGVGLSLPSSQSNGTAGITTPTNDLQIVIGCTQSTGLRQQCTLPNTQTLVMNYSLFTNNPPTPDEFITATETFTDFNVIGNPYHDVLFIGLTPQITFTGATVTSVTVTPDRTKLRVVMSSGQTLLFYLERVATPLPPTFSLNFDRNVLTASGVLAGYLRVAAIQVTPVPTSTLVPLAGDFNPYATSILNQTRPATPVAMFMLWPNEWLAKVGPQIATNLPPLITRPDCDTLANILPVLARTDPSRAFFYENQLNPANVSETTNTFISLFSIFAAQNLDSEIDSYQTGVLTPPILPIIPTAAEVETTYDTFRARIPLSTNVSFEVADKVSWTYTMEGTENDNPLVLFPSWKKLDGGGAPTTLYAYLDPIKGPLFGQETTDNTLTFEENPVPAFWSEGRFFPSSLAFDSRQRRLLQARFTQDRLQLLQRGDVVQTGRQLYKLALTALYGVELSRQTRGNARAATEGLIIQIKNELRGWLSFPHTDPAGVTLPDFFTGVLDDIQGLSSTDVIPGGICTTAGLGGLNAQTASPDDSNALFSNHHVQYGYYLGAAAIVIEWDNLFDTSNPFIAEVRRSSAGTFVTMRELIDMLWRDCRNYSDNDSQFPFNRNGNPWEGHSTQNGFLYTPLSEGRFQELFGEDFLSWMGVNQYARAILATPNLNLSMLETDQYTDLERFTRTNMEMTAASGKLVFQDDSWLYSGPYTATLTVGQVYDTQTLATTSTEPGDPCGLLLPAP